METTLFLSLTGTGDNDARFFRGLCNGFDVRVYERPGLRCVVEARDADGTIKWEELSETITGALGLLLEAPLMAGAERIVLHGEGMETSVFGRAAASLPPVEMAEGCVALPELIVAPKSGEGLRHITIDARTVGSIEYLRIGRRSGSVIVTLDGHWLLVGIEPGAVLMRVWRAAPEEAYRLGHARPLPATGV